MADKSTRLILDALSRAATAPDGLPLFGAKASPGLFPSNAAARAAAQRCKDDGYLQVLELADKPARELCGITDKGRTWLLHQVSPRQVLEDFVRVLEDRQKQADDLIAAARRMAASLDSLKTTVEQLRPLVQPSANGQVHHLHGEPNGEPPSVRTRVSPPHATTESNSLSTEQSVSARRNETRVLTDGGSPDLATDILAQLEQWHAASSGDCPLPELYRGLKTSYPELSIGAFHDGLRELHARNWLYLHPWTGPLYDLPEPPFALLVGHEIAFYASHKEG
ncbi:MAG: hypothetical protein ACJ8F7_04060 [Gemmataceae bacterium]